MNATTNTSAGPPPATGESRETAQDVLRRFSGLASARDAFDSIWEEVAEYMGPAYAGFKARPGHPRRPRPDLVDSTARRAAGIFAAGMLSGVSSPSQRWFRLTTADRGLEDRPRVRAWLQALEEIYCRALSRCGFYPQQTLGYHQAGLFGWQCMYVDEDPGLPDAGLRFRALPLHEVYVAENFQGEVDTVFRSFRLTARQAAQKWGFLRLPEALRRVLERGREEDREFAFLHAVFPRRDKAPGGGSPARARPEKARPERAYVSVYLERDSGEVVAGGHYAELPYIVTRSHRLPGTAYSYSPGTEALADAKMINEMKRLILEAGQLAVAPPYLVPDDGFLGRFSFEPRAMNYYRRAEGNSLSDFGPLSIGGEPRFSFELLASTKEDINAAFFVDLFLAVKTRIAQGAAPTAQEVAELAGERMFLLGPMLVNQQQENFRRLFARLHRLLARRGELPEPPAEAGGLPEVEYVSPLMLAQQQERTAAVLAAYGEVNAIAAIEPRVLDILRHDENVRQVLTQRGVPQAGVRTRDEVRALRAARAALEENGGVEGG
ncbi:portal protein [Desulfocurvus sp. DL9XJH121]